MDCYYSCSSIFKWSLHYRLFCCFYEGDTCGWQLKTTGDEMGDSSSAVNLAVYKNPSQLCFLLALPQRNTHKLWSISLCRLGEHLSAISKIMPTTLLLTCVKKIKIKMNETIQWTKTKVIWKCLNCLFLLHHLLVQWLQIEPFKTCTLISPHGWISHWL